MRTYGTCEAFVLVRGRPWLVLAACGQQGSSQTHKHSMQRVKSMCDQANVYSHYQRRCALVLTRLCRDTPAWQQASLCPMVSPTTHVPG